MAKYSKRSRAARAARKRSALFTAFVILLILALLLAVGYWYFFTDRSNPFAPDAGPTNPGPANPSDPSPSSGEELSIHFMELGNKYAGDSTLIKVGDCEVLIDAGSRRDSAKAVGDYVANYCTDGVLEYVVATHAHEDHISAFAGSKSVPGIFARFTCKTVIDFARTNSTSLIYGDYVAAREAEVAEGAVHYTALECWKEENGAKRTYALSESVSMTVLYQRYYEEKSSDENNYSVCLLFTQGNYHYLFTGDLEKEGEESLVASNDLPQVKLFKGGHHGSPTSSNEVLLEKIRPENVVVCCCAGSPEYTKNSDNTFPSQAMIDRVARYTKNIYVTTLATDIDLENKKWGFTSMNGNVVVRSDGAAFSIAGSHNSTLLKETDWFKKYRTWPAYGVQ